MIAFRFTQNRWLLITIIALLFTACSNSDSTTPPTPTVSITSPTESLNNQDTSTDSSEPIVEFLEYEPVPDACAFLTEEEARIILNDQPSATGATADDGYFSTCSWNAVNGSGSMDLNIWGNTTGIGDWATVFLNSQMLVGEFEPLSILGEEAYYSEGNNISGVYWRQDDAYVIVLSTTFLNISRDDVLALAEQIDSNFASNIRAP